MDKFTYFLVVICLCFSVNFAHAATVEEGEDIAAAIAGGTTDLDIAPGANTFWRSYIPINIAARANLAVRGTGGYVDVDAEAIISNVAINNAALTLSNLYFRPYNSRTNQFVIRFNQDNITASLDLTGSVFDGFRNTTTTRTGAILINSLNGVITIDGGDQGVVFRNNGSVGDGNGAVGSEKGTLIFNGPVYFENNYTGNYGGAIGVYADSANAQIYNGPTTFTGNHSVVFGGAVDVWGGRAQLTFTAPAVFTGNYVNYIQNSGLNAESGQHVRGGAMNIGYISSAGAGTIVTFDDTATFTGNYAVNSASDAVRNAFGGAVSVYGNGATDRLYYLYFNDAAVFQDNYVYTVRGVGNGGAIYYDSAASTLTLNSGTRFLNNYAQTYGGGIYLQSGTINLNATTADITFSGNRQGADFDASYAPISGTGVPNAVYLGSSGALNINAASGYAVRFNDPIASIAGSGVTLTKTGLGDVIFTGDGTTNGLYDSAIQATTQVNAGRFILRDGVRYGVTGNGSFSVADGASLLGGGVSTLSAANLTVAAGGRIGVEEGQFTLDATNITLGDGAVLYGDGTLASDTTLAMAGSVVGEVADGAELTLNAVLSGAGGLSKAGSGTLLLGVAPLYTGATSVAVGTLATGVVNALVNSSSVALAQGTLLDLRDNDQQITNLYGAGDVSLGGAVLSVVSAAESTLSGIISGTGRLVKTGAQDLILSGTSTYSGGTTISEGTLVATMGSALGSGDVTNSSTLELRFSGDETFGNTVSGGTLLKSGGGKASVTGNVGVATATVSAGTLALEEGGTKTVGNYTTDNGATTRIGSRSTLTATSFNQLAGSTLEIDYRVTDLPVITATSANLAGTLRVNDYSPTVPARASLLDQNRFLVLRADQINNDFDTVQLSGITLPYDFLVAGGAVNAAQTEYTVGLGLAWNAASNAHGTFTLPAGQSFEVDVPLITRPSNGSWDGDSLTKAGAGELILSSVNTYTGPTAITDGTLTAGTDNVFAQSSAVSLNPGATFALNGNDQSVQNLSGGGNVTLGSADLTVVSSGPTEYTGVISGDGGLVKDGSETFTLSGNNTYAGGTTISEGTLRATGAVLGDGAVTIGGSSALQLDFAGNATVANQLSGAGSLVKTGGGTASLTAASTIGAVSAQGGTLGLDQSGTFTAGSFTTDDGATTRIGASGTLAATTFTQDSGSNLEVAWRSGGNPVITTQTATLAGDLAITGFNPTVATSASGLEQNRLLVVSASNTIATPFASFSVDGYASPYDFLTVDGGLDATGTRYSVGLGLRWFADTDSSGTFTLPQGNTFTVDVPLTTQSANGTWDGNSLTKAGAGELVLASSNTYTGPTAITAGTLTAATDNVFTQSSAVSLNSGTVFALNGNDQSVQNLSGGGNVTLGSADLTVVSTGPTQFTGVISGDGGLVKDGSGTFTLSGNNTYAGGTTISDGTLRATGAVLGDGAVTIGGSSALQLDFAGNATVANQLSGAGSLVKSGGGTASLTAVSTVGAVSVQGGTLGLDQSGSFTAGPFTTDSGATTRIGASGTLAVTTFTQATGANLEVAWRSGGTPVITSQTASLAGDLAITGFSPAVAARASALQQNRLIVVSAANQIATGFDNVTFGGYGSPYDFLVVDGRVDASGTTYSAGLGLAWYAASGATGTFTLGSGQQFTVDVPLATQSGFGAWDGNSLTKAGAGNLILSADNTYTGSTTVTGGSLTAGAANVLQNSSGLNLVTGTAFNLNNNAQSLKELSGSGTVNLGTAALTVASTAGSIFDGTVAGSGSLVKSGTGTFVLTGNNAYTGGTTVNAGTLRVTTGGGLGTGTVNLGGGTLDLRFVGRQTLANLLTGTGNLVLSGSGQASLTAAGSGAGSVAVNAGTLVLAQPGAFTAGTFTTANGALTVVGADSSLTATTFTQSDGSGLEVSYRAGGGPVVTAQTANLAGSLTINGFTPSAGVTASSLAQSRFVVVSANTMNGDFAPVILGDYAQPYDFIKASGGVTGNEYAVGLGLAWFAGTDGSGTFTLGAGQSFDVDVPLTDQAGNASWDGQSLTKAGQGELVLSGANTYQGETTVSGGTLTAGADNVYEDSSQVSVASGATLDLNGYDQTARNLSGSGAVTMGSGDLTVDSTANSEFGGVISGSGSLAKTGSADLVLSGNSSYTGGTSITSGRLAAATGTSLGSGNVTVQSGSVLELRFAGDSTLANVLGGSGSLEKTGAGKAVLTGAGSAVGAVTNIAGTLALESDARFTAASFTNNSGATLNVCGTSWLDAGTAFVQQTAATLNVEVKLGQAAIVADSASIAGALNISGFTASNPMRASQLQGQRFTVLSTVTGISGDFAQVSFGSSDNASDYLLVTAEKSADNLAYTVGLELAWYAGNNQGNGVFTLGAENDMFEVDLPLTDQPGTFASGWDGRSLTKRGAGSLILSAANTYTGSTAVEGGVLQAGAADVIAASEELAVSLGAVFALNDFDQTVNNLTGAGSVALGSATLTAVNSRNTVFSGVISGDGGLLKSGTGELALSGVNTYGGGTLVDNGRLAILNGGAVGNGPVQVAEDGVLELRAASDWDFNNTVSGSGELEKTGAGTVRLGAAVGRMAGRMIQSIGTVTVSQGALLFDTVATSTIGDYLTAAGAETELSPGAKLAVTNGLTQEADAFLVVGLTTDLSQGAWAITAGEADITGSTLAVSDFTVDAPMKASEVNGQRFGILSTTDGITGDFASVTFGTVDDPADYLQVRGIKSADSLTYAVGLDLSWLSGATGHGTFTLNDAEDYFEVDIPLANQTATQAWDGSSLTKRGAGTLQLSAANTYSGPTSVEAGRLLVGDGAATGASVAGDVTVSSGAFLSGTGTVNGTVTNAGTLAALNALTGFESAGPSTFTVGGVVNRGTVLLAGSEVGNRLVVRGPWRSDGGSLVLNTVLGGDDSLTDRLVLDGGTASGLTNLVVRNQGGTGAQTNIGLMLVEAINGATTTTDSFLLSPDSSGYRTTTGTLALGAYDYQLLRGGQGGEAQSWYLVSAYDDGGSGETPGGEGPGDGGGETPGGGEGPGDGGGETPGGGGDGGNGENPGGETPGGGDGGGSNPVARPEAGIYLGNREAAETMFRLRLHDRLAGYEIIRDRQNGTQGPGATWLRVYGSDRHSRADNGNLRNKTQMTGVQAGIDLFRSASERYGSVQTGIMGGAGKAWTKSRSRKDGAYRAKGDTEGVSAGIYGTWHQDAQQRKGLWADAWVHHGWFENEVRGNGLPEERTKSRQWSGSLELGYTVPIYETERTMWVIEPAAQAIWSSYKEGRHKEEGGTVVRQGNKDKVSTRLGGRVAGKIDATEKVTVQPFVEAFWLNDNKRAKVAMNDDVVHSSMPYSKAEFRGGVGAQIGKNFGLTVDAIYRTGGNGFRETGGQLGFRLEF